MNGAFGLEELALVLEELEFGELAVGSLEEPGLALPLSLADFSAVCLDLLSNNSRTSSAAFRISLSAF